MNPKRFFPLIVIIIVLNVVLCTNSFGSTLYTYYTEQRVQTKEVDPETEETENFSWIETYLKVVKYYFRNELSYTDPETGNEFGRIEKIEVFENSRLRFNSSEGTYVNCGNNASLDLENDLTISIRAKIDVGTGGYLLSKRDGDQSQYGMAVCPNTGALLFVFGDANTAKVMSLNHFSSDWRDGQWHEFTITVTKDPSYDSIWVTGYVDGVSYRRRGSRYLLLPRLNRKRKSNDGIYSNPAVDVILGARGDGAGGVSYLLDGEISDVKIFNRGISYYETQQIFAGENLTAGLVSHWDFHEGSGTSLEDISGSNHGTIVSSGWEKDDFYWEITYQNPEDPSDDTINKRIKADRSSDRYIEEYIYYPQEQYNTYYFNDNNRIRTSTFVQPDQSGRVFYYYRDNSHSLSQRIEYEALDPPVDGVAGYKYEYHESPNDNIAKKRYGYAVADYSEIDLLSTGFDTLIELVEYDSSGQEIITYLYDEDLAFEDVQRLIKEVIPSGDWTSYAYFRDESDNVRRLERYFADEHAHKIDYMYDEEFYGSENGLLRGRKYIYVQTGGTDPITRNTYCYVFGTDNDLKEYSTDVAGINSGYIYYFYDWAWEKDSARIELDDGSILEVTITDNFSLDNGIPGMKVRKYTDPVADSCWFLWGSDVYQDGQGGWHDNVVVEEWAGIWTAYTFTPSEDPNDLLAPWDWTLVETIDDPESITKPERGSWYEWLENEEIIPEFSPNSTELFDLDTIPDGLTDKRIDHNSDRDMIYLYNWSVPSEVTISFWWDIDKDGTEDTVIAERTYGTGGDTNVYNIRDWSLISEDYQYIALASLTTIPSVYENFSFPRQEFSSSFETTIALLDTGTSNVNGDDNEFIDTVGHGTITSAIISAISPGISILSTKVFDDTGRTTTGIISEGIRRSVDMGASILTMPFSLEIVSAELGKTIDYALEKGAILIAAAGNEGRRINDRSLAAQEGVITVGSIGSEKDLEEWSNFGDQVDVFASFDMSLIGLSSDTYKGTSFSTAYVAALAGLIMEETPDITREELLASLGEISSLSITKNSKKPIKGVGVNEIISKQEAIQKMMEDFNGHSYKTQENLLIDK